MSHGSGSELHAVGKQNHIDGRRKSSQTDFEPIADFFGSERKTKGRKISQAIRNLMVIISSGPISLKTSLENTGMPLPASVAPMKAKMPLVFDDRLAIERN